MDRVHKFLISCLLLFVISSCTTTQKATSERHTEPILGVRFLKPLGWQRADVSQSGIRVVIYSPGDNSDARISFLLYPSEYLPEGLSSREVQVKQSLGKNYKQLKLEDVIVFERKWKTYVYATIQDPIYQTMEFGLPLEPRYLVVQFTAKEKDWTNLYETFNNVLKSIELFSPTAGSLMPVTHSTEPKLSGDVRIMSHSIDMRVHPATGKVEITDFVVIRAQRDGVLLADFNISPLDVIQVVNQDGALDFKTADFPQNLRRIYIRLDKPLNKDAEATITMRFEAIFKFKWENPAIAGYLVLGQVREDSSYSSHVLYYPMDEENTGSLTLKMTVPKGYIVAGPGSLKEKIDGGDVDTFTYSANDGLIKQLPYGWAVAKYEKLESKSKSGLPIEVYTFSDNKQTAGEKLQVATDVVNFYEASFGQFPFEKLAIAQVLPEKGMAGVSLPGLVLLSNEYFLADSSYAKLVESSQKALGALVIADEISHQYNFYSVSLPNVISEGLAQYTNSMFADHAGGAGAASKHFEEYARIYRGGIVNDPDAPILSEQIYRTRAYMAIVFSKGACIWHMLRSFLGDEAFFSGLKKFFADFRGKRATMENVRKSFETSCSKELEWFFDQWFQRSGYPVVRLVWSQKDKEVIIKLTQEHEGEPYRLSLSLKVESEGQKQVMDIMLAKKYEEFTLEASEKIIKVEISNGKNLLARILGE